MRLGVFGGTFDPVHLGHLITAEQCREQLALDQVLFIPAPRPPHKLGRETTPFDRRAEMLALALSGNPAFRIDEIERDRPGPSYTADTLAELQRRHAGAELFLIVGADALLDLPSWYQPWRIVELATLAVVARPGWELPEIGAVEQQPSLRGRPVRYHRVESPLIDIASRDIRRRVATGRSIRYLVPRAVEVYIHDKQLYRTATTD